ncbi:hypothetical protein JSCD10_34250 [Clostridioides difficile]|nr:hypothetical protein JSCD10_34250 [Clostridioides difficile]
MYFKKVELFDISNNINNCKNIYAHINKDRKPETLKEHSDLSYSVSYTHPEPTRLRCISYAVFCLKKKKI